MNLKQRLRKPRVWSEEVTVQIPFSDFNKMKTRVWFIGIWSESYGRYVVVHVESSFEKIHTYRRGWFRVDALRVKH